MTRAIAAAVIAIAACSAASAPQSAPSPLPSPLVRGGSDDAGDPAVAALAFGDIQFCTASLIAPKPLLTADHCAIDGAGASSGSAVGASDA